MPTFSFSQERYDAFRSEWADTVHREHHWITNRRVTTPSGSSVTLELPYKTRRWYALPVFQESYGVRTWGQLEAFLREYFPVHNSLVTALADKFTWTETESGVDQTSVTLRDNLQRGQPITVIVQHSQYRVPSRTVLLTDTREHRNTARKVWYDMYWGHNPESDSLCHILNTTFEPQPSTRGVPELYSRVMNYSYRPNFVYYHGKDKNSNLFFGVEVELSTEMDPSEFYRILTEVEPRQDPFFYFKSDSSVGGDKRYCMELVTHPCHPAYLRRNFRVFFQKLEKLCEAKGVRLEDVFDVHPHDNNGIHVHVSADSFTSHTELNKFVSLWNMDDTESVNFLQQISKRNTRYDRNRFCRINPDLYQRKTIYRLKNNGSSLGREARYSACHYTGSTVEVRLFQSIFDLNHILNVVSIVEAMHQFNTESSYSVLSRDLRSSFEQWVVNQGQFVRVKRILKGEK